MSNVRVLPRRMRSELKASVNNALLGALLDDGWLILTIELERLRTANCGVIVTNNKLSAFFKRKP
jgi:hypothetical protein